MSGKDSQPVGNLNAVVVGVTGVVLTWEKPADAQDSDIKVCFINLVLFCDWVYFYAFIVSVNNSVKYILNT